MHQCTSGRPGRRVEGGGLESLVCPSRDTPALVPAAAITLVCVGRVDSRRSSRVLTSPSDAASSQAWCVSRQSPARCSVCSRASSGWRRLTFTAVRGRHQARGTTYLSRRTWSKWIHKDLVSVGSLSSITGADNRNSLTTAQAAAILGRSRAHVPTIARRDGLTLTTLRGRVLLDRDEVEAYATALAKWISFAEAATASGLSVGAIQRAVKAGLVATRPDARPLTARLERDSVMAWAAAEKQRRQEAAAQRALPRRPETGPPNDGRSWMSIRSAAVLLGQSEYRTTRQIEREQLPATRHNGKWWLQPVHVFSVLAGREHRSKAG